MYTIHGQNMLTIFLSSKTESHSVASPNTTAIIIINVPSFTCAEFHAQVPYMEAWWVRTTRTCLIFLSDRLRVRLGSSPPTFRLVWEGGVGEGGGKPQTYFMFFSPRDVRMYVHKGFSVYYINKWSYWTCAGQATYRCG